MIRTPDLKQERDETLNSLQARTVSANELGKTFEYDRAVCGERRHVAAPVFEKGCSKILRYICSTYSTYAILT